MYSLSVQRLKKTNYLCLWEMDAFGSSAGEDLKASMWRFAAQLQGILGTLHLSNDRWQLLWLLLYSHVWFPPLADQWYGWLTDSGRARSQREGRSFGSHDAPAVCVFSYLAVIWYMWRNIFPHIFLPCFPVFISEVGSCCYKRIDWHWTKLNAGLKDENLKKNVFPLGCYHHVFTTRCVTLTSFASRAENDSDNRCFMSHHRFSTCHRHDGEVGLHLFPITTPELNGGLPQSDDLCFLFSSCDRNTIISDSSGSF